MTLLTTEIHNHNDPQRALIIFAADRRLSYSDGTCADTREKIFRMPRLNAGIGYFGLAEVPQGASCKLMADWLQEFVKRTISNTLEQFAASLVASLNALIPRDWYRSVEGASGFHIAGFSVGGLPEFWYVRNIGDDRQTMLGEFQAREDFQGRDVPSVQPGGYQVYRNGDIRAHVSAWENIDKSLGVLLNFLEFRQLTTPDEYVEWVKYKMELIAQFYERFCTESIIGMPVDAFAITRG